MKVAGNDVNMPKKTVQQTVHQIVHQTVHQTGIL